MRDIVAIDHAWDQGKASGRAGPLDIPRLIAEEKATQSSRRA
jgi:hypothetical protein